MPNDDFDPSKTPGTFEVPPANAPRETSQPLSVDAVSEQLARAAQNERELPPFEPRMGLPPPVIHAAPRQGERSHQPAASSTDSPSRGVPQPILDPGKRITGGFGHTGEAQYFPLDGTELRELVLSQFDALAQRLQNDLRFHIAITYPRVKVRVVVEVDAYAQESGFTVERIVEHAKTPVEVAHDHADHVTFVLVESRREVAEDGSSEAPPDLLREELGLQKPLKQQIELPGNQRMFVDVQSQPLDGMF